MLPKTLGQLKQDDRFDLQPCSVKDEIRRNLLTKLRRRETLFPGILGYDETAIPGIANALLSRHNFIILGLRGQAKSRILRQLTGFLDDWIPVIEGCEIHDDPRAPICPSCKRRLREEGNDLPLRFLSRDQRFVEKLATPDVTIADMIGDLDPIKAARSGADLSALDNIHFGLLPRAHRAIFAINELPDLAPKIQVGLFNILQEGDVQIKGFPIRLPLDVLMVFTANPEDYTARGKIITPLKDRIGAEIRTHYPKILEDGISITRQESWTERPDGRELVVPGFAEEIIELIAFHGRRDDRVDHRSGVSQRLPISCLEFAVSNAERRALAHDEDQVVVRVGDVSASLPTITGKLELEYEGEMRGAGTIGGELIGRAVLSVFNRHFKDVDFERIVKWFDLGGEVLIDDQTGSEDFYAKIEDINGWDQALSKIGLDESELTVRIAGIEFILEGLSALKKLSRNTERGFFSEGGGSDVDAFDELLSARESFN